MTPWDTFEREFNLPAPTRPTTMKAKRCELQRLSQMKNNSIECRLCGQTAFFRYARRDVDGDEISKHSFRTG
jgi:hypothetical protein